MYEVVNYLGDVQARFDNYVDAYNYWRDFRGNDNYASIRGPE